MGDDSEDFVGHGGISRRSFLRNIAAGGAGAVIGAAGATAASTRGSKRAVLSNNHLLPEEQDVAAEALLTLALIPMARHAFETERDLMGGHPGRTATDGEKEWLNLVSGLGTDTRTLEKLATKLGRLDNETLRARLELALPQREHPLPLTTDDSLSRMREYARELATEIRRGPIANQQKEERAR